MSEPLYSIGQAVAVCTPCLRIVLPCTVVTAARFDPPEISVNDYGERWLAPGGWYYFMDAPYGAFHESRLRPLHDDDYADPVHTSEPTGEHA